MEKKEAVWILENGAWWDSLPDDMSDADKTPLLAAIDIAIAALKMPEKREPLTIDQLREVPHGKIKDSTLKSICDRGNEIASIPAHIDREAWKPCDRCRSKENAIDRFSGHEFLIDDAEIYFYDSEDGWESEEIRFCPWCGRPLTEEAWAELEKRLRGCRE